MIPTIGALFAGGGLADLGAEQAGCAPLWAIERDPDAAASYRRNLGGRMIEADIRDVDPRDVPTSTIMHASPPCQTASAARSKRLPRRADADIGLEVLRFARALLPPAVTLENVPPYVHEHSFKVIVRGLWDLGYTVRWDTVDASDYGVPQSRRRLFMRAIRGGLLLPLPAPVRPKVGWYAALEDLLPGLPESRFAEWQLRRLTDLRTSALVHNQISQSQDAPIVRDGGEPGPIVTTNSGGRLRAFLVDGKDNGERGLPFRDAATPAQAIQASVGHNEPRAWLDGGRVVKLTPRCLARLMGLPDTYELPERAAVAGRIIGNGVCPPVMRMVCENVLLALGERAA